MARNLSEIAQDIRNNWKNPTPWAEPYIRAMKFINSPEPDAPYLAITAEDIVAYFLSNATGWRGEKARQIKQELKNQYHV